MLTIQRMRFSTEKKTNIDLFSCILGMRKCKENALLTASELQWRVNDLGGNTRRILRPRPLRFPGNAHGYSAVYVGDALESDCHIACLFTVSFHVSSPFIVCLIYLQILF